MWKAALAILLAAASARGALIVGPERPASAPRIATAVGYAAAVATDGSTFLVLWGSPVRATVVARDGSVPQVAAPVILDGKAQVAAIAWTGQSYLVIGTDANGIFSMRLSRSGEVLAAPRTILAGVLPYARPLAWNGAAGLLLYQPAQGVPARLAILTGDGRVGRTIPVPGSEPTSRISVAAGGGHFTVTWLLTTYPTPTTIGSRLYALEIASSGELLGGGPLALADFTAYAGRIASASDGRRTAVVFTSSTSGGLFLNRMIVDEEMRATALPAVSLTGLGLGDASVIWSGRDFVAYWMNSSSNRFGLFSIAFSSNRPGTALVYGDRSVTAPLIASTGSETLAVWSDYRVSAVNSNQQPAVFGAVVDPDMSRVMAGGTTGFPISFAAAAQSNPALASMGSGALLVWQEATNLPANEVRVTRLDDRGAPLDAQPIVVATSADASYPPAVVMLGGSYLVVWTDSGFVWGRLVHGDGTMDPPLQCGWGYRPVVASTGSTAVVAYAVNWGIRTVSIDAAGTPTPGYFLRVSSIDYSIAANESEFLFTIVTGGSSPQSPYLSSVWAWRFDAAGLAIDTVGIPIANAWPHKYLARVASNGRDFLVLTIADGSQNSCCLGIGYVSAKRVLAEGVLSGSSAGSDGVILAGETRAISVTRVGGGYAALLQTERLDGSRSANLLLLDPEFRITEEVDGIVDGPIKSAIAFGRGGATVAYTRMVDEPEYGHVPRLFLRQLAPESASRQRTANH